MSWTTRLLVSFLVSGPLLAAEPAFPREAPCGLHGLSPTRSDSGQPLPHLAQVEGGVPQGGNTP